MHTTLDQLAEYQSLVARTHPTNERPMGGALPLMSAPWEGPIQLMSTLIQVPHHQPLARRWALSSRRVLVVAAASGYVPVSIHTDPKPAA